MELSELYRLGTLTESSDVSSTDKLAALMRCYNENYNRTEIIEYLTEHFLVPDRSELEDCYYNNTLQIHTHCNTPQYEDLPLNFIRTKANTYFVLNRIDETIQGPINIDTANRIESDSDVLYQPVLIDGYWNLLEYSEIFSINQYGNIYLVLQNTDLLYLYSFLQLQEISTYFNDNHPLYLYDSTESYFEELTDNASLAIPQSILCDQTDGKMDALTSRIMEIHQNRIQKPKTNKPVLSICIPTYNRGKLAVGKLKELQALTYDTEIEFIISNNGSTIEEDQYDFIEAQTTFDHRIQYNRFETNQQFLGNFWKVIQMSSADHALLISDEDHVIPSSLPHYIGLLMKYPNIGIIRSGGIFNSQPDNIDSSYQTAGTDALQYFFLGNNYLSGIIYKSSSVPQSLPDEYNHIFAGNEAFRHYPHEFLDMFLCDQYDFISDKLPLFLCGEAQIYEEYKENNGQLTYQTRSSRLMQLVGFTELINHMVHIDDLTRLNLYVSACKKTLFLLKLNMATDDSWDQILPEFRSSCMNAYMILKMEHKDLIAISEIESLIEEFIQHPDM